MEVLRPKGKSHIWIIPSTLLLISLSILLWRTGVGNDFSRIDLSNIRPLLTWKRTDRNWITVEFDSNFTADLLSELPKVNDTSNPCLCSRTTNITIVGLGDMVRDQPVNLVAGEIYYYSILTFDETGNRRCSGGDYFETDLSSENWKSRPPVKDHGNGTYSFSFQIHPDFAAGDYNLTIYLLFRNYDGFIFPSDRKGNGDFEKFLVFQNIVSSDLK